MHRSRAHPSPSAFFSFPPRARAGSSGSTSFRPRRHGRTTKTEASSTASHQRSVHRARFPRSLVTAPPPAADQSPTVNHQETNVAFVFADESEAGEMYKKVQGRGKYSESARVCFRVDELGPFPLLRSTDPRCLHLSLPPLPPIVPRQDQVRQGARRRFELVQEEEGRKDRQIADLRSGAWRPCSCSSAPLSVYEC